MLSTHLGEILCWLAAWARRLGSPHADSATTTPYRWPPHRA
jgi:hypothetical protein